MAGVGSLNKIRRCSLELGPIFVRKMEIVRNINPNCGVTFLFLLCPPTCNRPRFASVKKSALEGRLLGQMGALNKIRICFLVLGLILVQKMQIVRNINPT